jgi:DNA-binding MarR family transcriptional regulator
MLRPSRERFNFEALADCRYAIRRYLNVSERNARAAGLEPQQYQALLAIKGVSPSQEATVGVFAERLQIQHHSAVELRSRVDRRQVLVQLTPTGERKLKRVSLPHRDELRTAGRRLLRALEDFISQNGSRFSTAAAKIGQMRSWVGRVASYSRPFTELRA